MKKTMWLLILASTAGVSARAHESGAAKATAAAVMIEEDIEYQPEVLTVHAGQPIRVENHDPFEHKSRITRLNDDGVLGAMAVAGHVDKPGRGFTFTLKQPGTYEIRCLLHDGMAAVIRVVP